MDNEHRRPVGSRLNEEYPGHITSFVSSIMHILCVIRRVSNLLYGDVPD